MGAGEWWTIRSGLVTKQFIEETQSAVIAVLTVFAAVPSSRAARWIGMCMRCQLDAWGVALFERPNCPYTPPRWPPLSIARQPRTCIHLTMSSCFPVHTTVPV